MMVSKGLISTLPTLQQFTVVKAPNTGGYNPCRKSHAHILSRNLIYAASRGKAQVCIVGEIKALENALAQYQKDFGGPV